MAEGLPRKDPKDQGFGRLLKKDEDGNTPLHVAALAGNADVIRALLDIDMDALEVRNTLGQTPLYLSVVSGNNEAVECLLEAGADLTTKAEDGTTIWHAAALAGGDSIMMLLAEATKVTTKGNIPAEVEARDSINSERGEFENFLANKSTDKTNNKNIFTEQNATDTLNFGEKYGQIKKNMPEPLQKQKLSKNSFVESEKTHAYSEKRIPSAWENIYKRAEDIAMSSESEQEDIFSTTKENGFSPFININNRREKYNHLEINKSKSSHEDAQNRFSSKNRLSDNDQLLHAKKLTNSSCNVSNDANKQNPKGFERPINISPGNVGGENDNSHKATDSNKTPKGMSKSKKKRERRKKRNLLNRNNGYLFEGNSTSNADPGHGDESDECTIFLDLTKRGNQKSSKDLSPERESVPHPKFMKNNQRRNKNWRKNNRREESTDGAKQIKTDCETLMEEAKAYVRHRLFLMELIEGHTKNVKNMRERVHSCLREFFETQEEREVDVHSTDEDGRTLLHHASMAGAVGTVRVLLQAGANVNLPDNENVTPMHLGALGGSPKVVELLAENGGKLDTSCITTGEAPIHIAARYNYHQTVQKLLELGAHPNVVNNENRTPLQVALSKGNTASGVTLMKHGASLQPKNVPRR